VERCVGTVLECGAVCWDRTGVWSGVLGPYWSMERFVGTVLECGAVCWDPYKEGQISVLNRVQKRAAKFANNMNEVGRETLTQRRLTVRICALFKASTGGRAWKAIGDRRLKLCYLSRDDHNRKIRTRKQRTDVGKYSFVNRINRRWNKLPAG
jgi:hypothetical protein